MAKTLESTVAGNARDSGTDEAELGWATKGGMMGEPKEVEVDASARGPRVRHKGDEDEADNGHDTPTGKGGDIPAWDTTDDPRGRRADWPDRGVVAAGTKGVVEEQEG